MHLSHGPRTFELARNHLGCTHEEAPKLALGHPLVTLISQAMLQGNQPISRDRCAAPRSYSLQNSGKGECPNIASTNVAPSASLRSWDSPSTSTAPPRLATRPDPSHVSYWVAITNQATISAPDPVELFNHTGESRLRAFVDSREGIFCRSVPVEDEFCGYRHGKKQNLRDHLVRKHFDHRPWRCDGQCVGTVSHNFISSR